MSSEHPAIEAAHRSWDCVQRRAREEWIGLMADDITLEDPIGVAPTNPTGKGLSGIAGAQEFWENNIGRTESIAVEAHESFAAGSESAHVLTLTTKFPNGMTTIVHGIFTYAVNEAGKLRAMRGYWSLEEMKVIKAPESA
jgi:steroid delta-isomerase